MRRMRLKQHNGHIRFFSLLSLLLLLIIVRYSLQIDIPKALFLAVIFLAVAMGTRDEVVAMIICCIPLHESVDFFYAMVICTMVLVFKNYRNLRINLTVIPILLMIVWELLHCLTDEFSVIGVLTGIIPLLTLAVFMSVDMSDLDYGVIVRSFAFTTVMVCTSILIQVLYLSDFNVIAAFSRLQRLGAEMENTKISGGLAHPNTLGIICVLATTALMQLRMVNRKAKPDLPMAIILLVFGTLTASRTFLACLALMLILLLLGKEGGFHQKLRFMGSILIVLIMAIIVLQLLFPELLQYFYRRFLVKDITTGRIGLMAKYHNFIVSHPGVLGFGIGLQNLGEKVTVVYRVANVVPHNGIQELVIAWGLPGLILFGGLGLAMIWQSGKYCGRRRLINYIPILIILFKSQAGQMLNSAYTMLAFSYAYLSMSQNFSGGMERKNR